MLVEKRSPDLWLFIVVILLVAVGICMVFSSSYIMAYKWYGDSYYFLKRRYNSFNSIFFRYIY